MPTFHYRRSLTGRDWAILGGVAAGAGMAAAYLGALFLRKTPLRPPVDAPAGVRQTDAGVPVVVAGTATARRPRA